MTYSTCTARSRGELVSRFGPWKSVYNRFANRARRGQRATIFLELQYEIDDTGMKPVIHSKPRRKIEHRLVRALYRQRFRVEVFFHNLKRFRGIATRHDKTARNHLALVHLACARRGLEI